MHCLMTIYSKPVLSARGAMKNSLYKWYSKVYFPLPTSVCGVTGTFIITVDVNALRYLLTIPFALSDDNIIQICSVSLVVQCRTPFTKRVTKKGTFPFRRLFTVQQECSQLLLTKLCCPLKDCTVPCLNGRNTTSKKSRLRKSAFCFA